MREKLEKQNNVRSSFTGIFERFGTKSNYHGFPVKTVLLKEIRDVEDNVVCDHAWFNNTKQFQALVDMKQGDTVRFDARVKSYVKGYVNHREYIDEREVDYRLSHPTKVTIIEEAKCLTTEKDL